MLGNVRLIEITALLHQPDIIVLGAFLGTQVLSGKMATSSSSASEGVGIELARSSGVAGIVGIESANCSGVGDIEDIELASCSRAGSNSQAVPEEGFSDTVGPDSRVVPVEVMCNE